MQYTIIYQRKPLISNQNITFMHLRAFGQSGLFSHSSRCPGGENALKYIKWNVNSYRKLFHSIKNFTFLFVQIKCCDQGALNVITV